MAKLSRDSNILLKESSELWDAGQRKAAFKLLLEGAQSGDPGCQHNLAYFYDVGEGIRKDTRMALYWYKRAWSGDHDSGTSSNIARVYVDIGNRRRALYWWKKSLSKGDGDAALGMARFLIATKQRGWMRHAEKLLRSATASRYITQAGAEEAVTMLNQLRGLKHPLIS